MATVLDNRRWRRSVTVVLFLLAAVWVAFLLPPYLRRRSERRTDSISSFRLHLSTLARTAPGAGPAISLVAPPRGFPVPSGRSIVAMPVGRAQVRRRRRDLLCALVGVAGFTLVVAVVFGGFAIVAQLATDVILVGYVSMLVRIRKSVAERALKVRYLPAPGLAPEPALLLGRSASN